MKSVKKVFCTVLALLFVFSVMPVSAYSVKQTGYLTSDVYTYEFGYDNSNGCTAAIKSYNSQYPMTGNYYDQLNATQKEIYNAILGTPITTTQFALSLQNPIEYTYSYAPPSDGGDAAYAPIADAVVAAYFALIRDCPERFWYYRITYGFTTNYGQSGSLYYYSITDLTIKIGFHPSYSASTITATYANLMSAVNAFTPKGSTRYEKLRSIHDYIVNKATYDPNYNNSNAATYGHQPTGCLLSPYLCVCEGYAEAFKLFADKIGVPNVLVTSEDHIWNVVLMEDGKWYAIDCTWDDPVTGSTSRNVLRYNYFLVGSQTKNYQTIQTGIDENNNPIYETVVQTYAVSHVEESVYTASTGASLTNPTLSSTAYSNIQPMSTDRSDSVQTNDHPGGSILKGKMLAYIVPGKTIADSFAFNTLEVADASYSGDRTGDTLAITLTGGAVENYTVIMRGDVDKDADSDATDISKMRNIVVGIDNYYSTAPETYAGDLNNDGVVDGFDLALLDRYQNGKYSFY